jgi:hypothetical protein
VAAPAEKLQKDRKMKVEKENPINEYRRPFVVLRRSAPASTVPQMVLGTEISKAERLSGNRTRMLHQGNMESAFQNFSRPRMAGRETD